MPCRPAFTPLLPLLPIALGAGGLLPGCMPPPAAHRAVRSSDFAAAETLAPGVIHRAIPLTAETGIDLIEIDLKASSARLTVQAWNINPSQGAVVGEAYTPRQWLMRTGAIAAVNGGYFGHEDAQGRKELVGLLIVNGRVRHAAPPLFGSGGATTRRGKYVRSAFGLTADGKPSIVWAATRPGRPQTVDTYTAPMGGRGVVWHPVQAVGCGPMLISDGKVVVTDYDERLVSPGPQPRTFVAYDSAGSREDGGPRHLVFGMASGATYKDLAAFLAAYFPRYTRTRPQAAMCLDGGASTQLTYRVKKTLQSPRETEVSVPDALVLLPGR